MTAKTILMGAVGVAMLTVAVSLACDNKKAPDSTGACDSTQSPLCSDHTSQSSCENTGTLNKDVNEDFPQGDCLTQTNSNCNSPLEHCYITCNCIWVDGECTIDVQSEDGHDWTSKPKKTTVRCGS